MAVVVYTNPETGKRAWDVPGWCSSSLLAYISPLTAIAMNLSACQPLTPEQIAETTLSNVGAAAAANPTVAAHMATIANAPPTDPYYCQADPQGCADYKEWLANPTLATLLGPGTAGAVSSVTDFFNPATPNFPTNMLLVGFGAFVLLMLVRR